jgi:hypothetical protein
VSDSDRRCFQRDPTTNQTRGEWEDAYNFAMNIKHDKGYKLFTAPHPAFRTYVFVPINTSEAPEEYTLLQTANDQRERALQIYRQ